MPIFWPYLFTYENPVKAKESIHRQTIPFTHCYLFDGFLRFVDIWGFEIFKRFPVQFSVRTLRSRQNPMPLSQALVKICVIAASMRISSRCERDQCVMRDKSLENLKAFSSDFHAVIAAPEIVYCCELISQRFFFFV